MWLEMEDTAIIPTKSLQVVVVMMEVDKEMEDKADEEVDKNKELNLVKEAREVEIVKEVKLRPWNLHRITEDQFLDMFEDSCVVLSRPSRRGREFESVERRENHFPPLIAPMFKPIQPKTWELSISDFKGIDYTVC